MTRDEYMELLNSGKVVIHFKKNSGEDRLMLCTLQKKYILTGTKDPMDASKVRNLNEEVLPVWDLMANGWRSFRLDAVKGVYKG